MKTFRTIIAVVGLALVFAGCPGTKTEELPDVTSPTINVPSGVIEVGLGDKDAVSKGVTASDEKDGDLTKSIRLLSEVERIGLDTVKFEVTDAAGNKGMATRIIKVKSGKLAGKYNVHYKDVKPPNKGGTYPIEVFEDATVRLIVSTFHYFTARQITLISDGTKRLKIEEGLFPHDGDRYHLEGSVTFESADATKSQYNLVSFNYVFTPDNPSLGVQEYTATCERLGK